MVRREERGEINEGQHLVEHRSSGVHRPISGVGKGGPAQGPRGRGRAELRAKIGGLGTATAASDLRRLVDGPDFGFDSFFPFFFGFFKVRFGFDFWFLVR